jgi:ubiquinone/menaquinone biosynthesis C-methylase UbiE
MIDSKRQTVAETQKFFEREAVNYAAGAEGKEGDELKLMMIRDLARPGDRLLDIGGGNGYFTDRVLAETDIREACLLDISHTMLALNRRKHNKELVQASALNMPFKKGSFEFIHFDAVLHHIVGTTRKSSVEQAQRVIRNSINLVKKDGFLVFTERCVDSWISSAIIFYTLKFLSRTGLAKLGGVASGLVVSFLTPDEFLAGIKIAGASVIRVEITHDRPKILFRLALCRDHPRLHVLAVPINANHNEDNVR